MEHDLSSDELLKHFGIATAQPPAPLSSHDASSLYRAFYTPTTLLLPDQLTSPPPPPAQEEKPNKRGKPDSERLCVCVDCGKRFARPDTLAKHKMLHTGQRPFSCGYCQSTFIQKVHLQKHVMRAHLHTGSSASGAKRKNSGISTKVKTEVVQNSTSLVAENLTVHPPTAAVPPPSLRTIPKLPPPPYPVSCIPASTSHLPINNLTQNHLEVKPTNRVVERPTCPLCAIVFTNPSHLEAHIAQVHTLNERRYQCDICLVRFARKSNLDVHSRVHTGERPYKCSECGAGFIRSDTLKKHAERQHTGDDRRFRCTMCPLAFKQESQLARHTLSHSNTSPLRCELCGKEFLALVRLHRHLARHANSERFKCVVCHRKFFSHRSLEQHRITRKHGG